MPPKSAETQDPAGAPHGQSAARAQQLFAQAFALHQQGGLAQARALYEQVIEIEPAHFDALHFLGIIAYQASQPELAAELMGRAIDINPGHAEAHSNRGNVLRRLRQFAASLQSYDRAIELKPDYPDAYNNRGNVLRDLGQREAALLSYDRAIELRADYADAWVNRGNALRNLGRHEAALQSYDRAIALKPDYVAAHNNRGVALRDLRRYQQAVQSYDRAIALKPGYAEAHGNRANALRDLKQYEAALQSYERAIALKPDYAEAYSNRGTTLNELNRPQAALASLDRALQIDPDYDFLYGAWLLTKMSICDWKDIAYHFAHLIEKIERNEKATAPFILLAIPCLPAQQRKAAEIWLEAKYPASNALPTIARRPAHDRIRIAYVSGDFREHPVAHLMAELFERHERTRFEPIAISLRPEAESRTGQRVRRAFAQFVDVSSKSDLEVAQLMRGLEIDIAVDLMGFTTDSRTGVFAHRPAPIQVIYLGYTGTMGMSYMDYLIADERVIPESHRSFYAEKIAYVPDSFMPRDATLNIGSVPATRASAGLPPEGFVYCSINSPYKLNPAFFDIWMRLLTVVPASVLWLPDAGDVTKRNLIKEAERRGVSADRLVFARRTGQVADHLARLTMADLFLDTLPLNACTTASDALWAGLPVLTCMGGTFAGRVAYSLLHALQLPELITTTLEQYEALAVELANNPQRLKEIRQKLATNRLTTPLFDTPLLTRNIEAAYTKMYERYHAGLPPDHLYITS